jgi:ABC-type Fe3+/spermidine/putrescine transport system ATPase subunit
VRAALVCSRLVVSPGGAPVLRGLDLEIPAGTRTALVGPSGAGKTTLLRAIAGLTPVSEGTIRLGGRELLGVPPHRRRIAVVFQEPRLLPHLSVEENVAFPLRAAGVARAERRARARERLDEVGLGGLAGRGTAGLSGGEQQRVALARALSAEPDLLMLDEPLAAVDPNRREGLRRLIVRLQEERGLTALLVTHDRAEAAELGEAIALMLEGRIVQQGPPRELFERPASAAAARFFGMANLVRGTVAGGALEVAGASIPAPGPDGPAALVIRPEHVVLDDGAALVATVEEAVYAGTHVRLRLRRGEQRLEAHVPPALAPPAGAEVGLELPLERLWRLPGDDDPASVRAGGSTG